MPHEGFVSVFCVYVWNLPLAEVTIASAPKLPVQKHLIYLFRNKFKS